MCKTCVKLVKSWFKNCEEIWRVCVEKIGQQISWWKSLVFSTKLSVNHPQLWNPRFHQFEDIFSTVYTWPITVINLNKKEGIK
jgi:hypothetical protein